MKISTMKIRDKFIEAILHGKKKHEYRLGIPERKALEPGDQLFLVSTQDQNRHVRVSIAKKEEFPDWETALDKYWKDDFSENYKSIDEVKKECGKFYSRDEVKQHGIVVFTIAPVQISYRNKNVLLDTNIVIHRESYSNVTFEVSRLYKWLDELKCKKMINPDTIEEIKRYKDPAVVAAMSTKLASYDVLVDEAISDQNFIDAMAEYKQDQNGLIDNKLLYQVYRGTADLLITDDKLMLSKASRIFIRDQVLSVDEYLHTVDIQFPKLVDYKMLAVKKKPFGKIDLANPFFDTLKEDYPGFESWFKKKSSEEAYTFEQAGTILGFLYLKREYEDEVYSDIVPVFPKKNRLKVGTFKIDDALSGFRLGERFIKIIFDNAVAAKIDEIYVTLFEGKRDGVDALRDLLKKWGFVYWGDKGQESVFVKNMRGYDASKGVMFNFPNIENHPRLFFLPIKAEYHTGLFPDSILRNEDMSLYSENKGHLYSLEKIYVTNAFPTGWRPGDVLVIYRMGERWPRKYSSVCTGLAVLESVLSPSTLEEYLKECKNKSIFSEKELVGFYNVSSYRTVVKMIAYKTFDDKITLDELQTRGLIMGNSGPRPFEEISDDYYDLFML